MFVSDLYDYSIHPNLFISAGSPRVGDSNFWKWFELNIIPRTISYRFVDEKDTVPHVGKLLEKYIL